MMNFANRVVILVVVVVFVVLAGCTIDALGSTNAPALPIDRFPPFPVPVSEGGFSNGADIIVTQFVMGVEYQTNAAHGSIMEFQYVPITNYVPRYPRLLYAQLMLQESLNGEKVPLGAPLAFKLGDAEKGFYTVELTIE